jgi:hypothetical protein
MGPAMTSQSSGSKKGIIYALLGAGFVGLIGAHEVAVTAAGPGADARMAAAFLLAAAGTLCFVAAGILAIKLMRGNASK